MKIAFFAPYFSRMRRGIERYVWSLGNELAANDHDVHILSWGATQPVNWGESHPNLHIKRTPSFRYYEKYTCVPFYLWWLLQEQYDWVVLAFASYGEGDTLRLSRILNQQPNVMIVGHFPMQVAAHRYQQFAFYGLLEQAEQHIAVAHHVAEGIEARYGQQWTVIPNGVYVERLQPDQQARQNLRQQLGVSETAPVLVSMAALEERKGVQHMIRAVPHLLTEYPDLQYWVLGEGDLRPALEAEIQALGLESHVRLFGSVDDVVPYLAAADIGLLLSYGEAFPLTIPEYMAMQLPVITSQHPPFDRIVDATFGLRVDESDSTAVAETVATLLQNPEQRAEMGQAARLYAEAHYDWSQIAVQYEQAFRSRHS